MDQIRVGVMNTSKEITKILMELLEREGFGTCSVFTYELKEYEERFDQFVKDNKPAVVVFDVAIPYKDNYELFLRLSQRPSAKGIGCVLTTTNKKALESVVGKTSAHEVIGKPYDMPHGSGFTNRSNTS